MLVGTVDRSAGRVTVSGVVPATTAIGRVASLTFTHETWDEVDREMAAHFPELEIVGWYHSHPRFGIFLSSHDLLIHENFFSQPGKSPTWSTPSGITVDSSAGRPARSPASIGGQ